MNERRTKRAKTRLCLMQAITTKYVGATSYKPSRVKATAEAGSITLSWDSSLDENENYAAACRALADKWEWGGDWVGGGTAQGYVFVNVKKPTWMFTA